MCIAYELRRLARALTCPNKTYILLFSVVTERLYTLRCGKNCPSVVPTPRSY